MVADFNGDGRDDVVTANGLDWGHSSVSISLNNGTGGFGAAANYRVWSGGFDNYGGTYKVVVGDLNGMANLILLHQMPAIRWRCC